MPKDGDVQDHPGRRPNGRGRHSQNGGGENVESADQRDIDWKVKSAKLKFGPLSQATEETIRQMSTAEEALRKLSSLFEKQSQDLQQVPKIFLDYQTVQDDLKAKDIEIQMQKDTIHTLQKLSAEQEGELRKEMVFIQGERQRFEVEKEKFRKDRGDAEKRLKARLAEQTLEQEKQLREHKQGLEKEMEDVVIKKRQELGVLEAELNKKATDLDDTNKKLTEKLQWYKNKHQEMGKELASVKDDCENLRAIKTSLKLDQQALQAKFSSIEMEFAMNTQGSEYYQREFLTIESGIEYTCNKYFTDPEVDDLNEDTHKRLLAADLEFESVPISTSVTSQQLRIVHAQRIISSAIHEFVWQPFISEVTVSHPENLALLRRIALQLSSAQEPNSTARVASIWSSVTRRALQQLPDSSSKHSTSTLTSQRCSRAEMAVAKMLSVLSLLLLPAQLDRLRNDLLDLVESATSLWDIAQTDSLQFSVSMTVEEAGSDWRAPLHDFDGYNTTAVSSGKDKVLTLFPKVTAWMPPISIIPTGLPPGSWPESTSETHQPERHEIHAGRGLSESSALVIAGKDEVQCEREDIQRALEKVKLDRRALSGGHSKTASDAGSLPLSPSSVQPRQSGKQLSKDNTG